MNWNVGIPLLSKEVWLRTSKKWPRSLTGAAGVVSYPNTTTPAGPWKGGECPRFQFIHTFIDPYGAAARKLLRKRAGGTSNSRLKARLNAASDSYPTSAAISATLRQPDFSIRAPSCKRQRVRYVIGGSPR